MRTIDAQPGVWYPCDDDNYWAEDTDGMEEYVTLVYYEFEYSDSPKERYVNSYRECPYGWGTLAKMDAKFCIVKKPE